MSITELLAQKEAEYGNAVENMDRLAEVWDWYLSHVTLPLTGKDAALMNVLFKVSREIGKHKPDNADDIIGYANIAKQCAEVTK